MTDTTLGILIGGTVTLAAIFVRRLYYLKRPNRHQEAAEPGRPPASQMLTQ